MKKQLISAVITILLLLSGISAFAAEPRPVRVGAFNYYPAIFKDTDGVVKGFYVDALADVARRENIRFEYVYGSWNERLKSGEVDMLTSVAFTPERARIMDYASTPLLTVWGELYVPHSSGLDGIRAVQGKKIAVMKGDFNARHFIELVKKFDIDCEFIEMPGFEDVFKAVAAKEVDAGVVNNNFGVAKQKEYNLRSTGVVFNPFDIFFTVAKGNNSDLLALLNRHLASWHHQENSAYNKARQKWSHGTIGTIQVIPRSLINSAKLLCVLVFAAVVFIVLLKRQVRRATGLVSQREASLLQSKERFDQLARQSRTVHWEVDARGLFTYVSPVCEAVFGYRPEEIICKLHFYDIHPEEGREAFKTTAFDAFSRKEPFQDFQNPVQTGDGRTIWVSTNGLPLLDEKEILTGYSGTDTDITGRKQMLDSLRDSEERYRIVVEGTDDLVTKVDTAGNFVFVNHASNQIFGLSPGECIGRPAFDFIHPDDRQVTAAWFQEAIRLHKTSDTIENRQIGKNGEIHHILWMCNLLYAADGNIVEVISIGRDITELKDLEKERLKIEKLESLGVMAGGIAHDFNNILTGIMGNISFALMSIDPTHRSYKRLTEAEKASVRAAELAQQLLTFARGGEPVKKIVSVQQLVSETVALVLRGSNVRGTVEIPETLHAIEADEGQISQVFHNIIINATQAMPGGGTVKVSAQNETLQSTNTLSLPAGSYVRISFADNGCGIAPDDLNRIFDPYFTTKSAGNGLGLASVHSIVNRHGGHIAVSSAAGAGTTFTIHLPSIGESYTMHQADTSPQTVGDHPGGAILVMDDEEIIRDMITEMLEYLGYKVTTALNGEETVAQFKAASEAGAPFLAVIMDLTIPGGMGGKEAAREILAIDPAACLIVSSGYSNDPIMADYGSYGFRRAVAKPYSIQELGQLLSALLATR